MGHLGNHILNAAEFHASDRNFGMERLMPINRTWVLSRLAVEMNAMPVENQKFNVSTWVESAMKYFTNRNFEITAEDGQVMGHARSDRHRHTTACRHTRSGRWRNKQMAMRQTMSHSQAFTCEDIL